MIVFRRMFLALTSMTLLGFGSHCLQLETNPASNLAALISAMDGGPQSFLLFPYEADASGQSNGMIRATADGQSPQLLNLEWVPFPGGPANNWKAAVNNGVIYILQDDGEDELWISRDQGENWEIFEAPADNEDENLTNVLSCGNAVLVSYSSISQGEEDAYPAYVSYDNGRNFQRWHAQGSGDVTVQGMDCNQDRVIIATTISQSEPIQWAPISNLNNGVIADNHTFLYTDYVDVVAGDQGVIGLFNYNGESALGYDTRVPFNIQDNGQFPISFRYDDFGIPGGSAFGDSHYYVTVTDSGDGVCRVYKFLDGSTPPDDAPFSNVPCSDLSGSPGHMPALATLNDRILVSYRTGDGTDGGLAMSVDEGLSYESLDIDSVWNDDGFIRNIEVLR